MDCPRCGTQMSGGVCPECGFPVTACRQVPVKVNEDMTDAIIPNSRSISSR